MTPRQRTALDLAAAIETEMKRLGLWVTTGVDAAQPVGAFGAGRMPFEQWLQLVFLPNLVSTAQTDTFPASSHVAIAAVRNLDGLDNSDLLIELLSRVDRLVNENES